MSYFAELISSIFEKQNYLPNFIQKLQTPTKQNIEDTIDSILSTDGEVSSIIYSENLMELFWKLNSDNQLKFFLNLLKKFDIKTDKLSAAIITYQENSSAKNLATILENAEPGWVELFKRINAVPSGTIQLVKMRETLLKHIRERKELKRLDIGLVNLFRNWFNPGFLVLRPIDWSTPANILEKIIAYEAVHEISSWSELRRRLAPKDRKCFAFFHPAIREEPLIFVEIALMETTPGRIADVLQDPRVEIDPENSSTAIFYSISNCQPGLAGISFGNFLIKRVASELKKDFPNLTKFVTLSPIPGFMNWLKTKDQKLYASLNDRSDATEINRNKDTLLKHAAQYLLISERPDRFANDVVTRFHVGNGATVDRINFLANNSKKSLKESVGLMVNYKYDLKNVEKNHEMYRRKKIISSSIETRKLLK